jgi:threonine dehydrogenase-like Zn-dependent dehydrogenase
MRQNRCKYASSVTSKEAEASAMKGRIAFIPAAHKIDFHEYNVPAPPTGRVVAEVTQTNVCGSEVHIWPTSSAGTMERCPAMRWSGQVMALGDGAGSPAT